MRKTRYSVVPVIINTSICPGCPKCGLSSKGDLTCCGKGGSWQGKCGPPGNGKFEYTWGDGEKACAPAMQGTCVPFVAKGRFSAAPTTRMHQTSFIHESNSTTLLRLSLRFDADTMLTQTPRLCLWSCCAAIYLMVDGCNLHSYFLRRKQNI